MLNFEALVTSSKTDSGFDCEFGTAKLQLSEDLSEFRVAEKDFVQVMEACDRIFSLCDVIDSNGGLLEHSVLNFVNHNQELSQALGISLAMEADDPEAAKENGEKVTEKKQGILRRAWEAIKAFFKKIGTFFKRIFLSIKNKITGKHALETAKSNAANAKEISQKLLAAPKEEEVREDTTVEQTLSPSTLLPFFENVDPGEIAKMHTFVMEMINKMNVNTWSRDLQAAKEQMEFVIKGILSSIPAIEKYCRIITTKVLDDVEGSSTKGQAVEVKIIRFFKISVPNRASLKAAGWFEMAAIASLPKMVSKAMECSDAFLKMSHHYCEAASDLDRYDFDKGSLIAKYRAPLDIAKKAMAMVGETCTLAAFLCNFVIDINDVVSKANKQ